MAQIKSKEYDLTPGRWEGDQWVNHGSEHLRFYIIYKTMETVIQRHEDVLKNESEGARSWREKDSGWGNYLNERLKWLWITAFATGATLTKQTILAVGNKTDAFWPIILGGAVLGAGSYFLGKHLLSSAQSHYVLRKLTPLNLDESNWSPTLRHLKNVLIDVAFEESRIKNGFWLSRRQKLGRVRKLANQEGMKQQVLFESKKARSIHYLKDQPLGASGIKYKSAHEVLGKVSGSALNFEL